MGNVNCLRCRFRHEDNGNCTAVGGFCTAVPAAHCPLLRKYLDTGLTPEEVERSKLEIEAGCVKAIARTYGIDINRLRKLAEADREGRLFLLPLEPGRSMLCPEYFERPWVMKNVTLCVQSQNSAGIISYMGYYTFSRLVENGRIIPLSPEGEKALEAMKDG